MQIEVRVLKNRGTFSLLLPTAGGGEGEGRGGLGDVSCDRNHVFGRACTSVRCLLRRLVIFFRSCGHNVCSWREMLP